ncbi:MAG: galactosamine-6-phosphate isomerase [Luteitalea sp.]|nr:galactosamine-6-phosphate isomerase [Luteitalea sp.]
MMAVGTPRRGVRLGQAMVIEAALPIVRPESGFDLRVSTDEEAASQAATDLIIHALRARPDLLMSVATGSSPQRLYELLGARRAAEPTLFERLRVLKLDEWGGLALDDPGSCEAFVRMHVRRPLGIPDERYVGFDGGSAAPDAECRRVQGWLEAHGPIDVCVLGLGMNGHLGLNEPGSELQAYCHSATLADSSRQHPMLARARTQPSYGLTLGMADILRARQILLLVFGRHKRVVLRRLLTGPITTSFPASFLWLHGAATCLCDQAAVGDV